VPNGQEHDNDDLNMALDGFDEELNLTGEEVKADLGDDPDAEAKVKEEYEKFMK
jgi:hypothetical protein